MKSDQFIFENLDVYKRSLDLSTDICREIIDLPYKYARIRDQLIGAVISIPLNIAEGSGRSSSKEKVNFYVIARGSSFECLPLFEILLSLNVLDKNKVNEWRSEIRNICRMLSGLIRYQRDK